MDLKICINGVSPEKGRRPSRRRKHHKERHGVLKGQDFFDKCWEVQLIKASRQSIIVFCKVTEYDWMIFLDQWLWHL